MEIKNINHLESVFFQKNQVECKICYDQIDINNFIAYQYQDGDKWLLSPHICSNCLDQYQHNSSNSIHNFIQQMTSIQGECAKRLKLLLQGELGVPVHISDSQLFPTNQDGDILNILDPKYGRKNEIYRLMGPNQVKINPKLTDAPETRADLIQILKTIVDSLDSQLQSYNIQLVDQLESLPTFETEIIQLVNQLKIKLHI